jgi:hypothetical protein
MLVIAGTPSTPSDGESMPSKGDAVGGKGEGSIMLQAKAVRGNGTMGSVSEIVHLFVLGPGLMVGLDVERWRVSGVRAWEWFVVVLRSWR